MTKLQRSAIAVLKNNGGELRSLDALWIRWRTWESLLNKGYVHRVRRDDDTYFVLNQNNLANTNGKVSKKNLEDWCKKNNYPMPDYEVYGRQVDAYFYKAPDGMTRRQWEAKLESVGCKVNRNWCASRDHDANRTFTGTCVENISYFKGWHWDE